MYLSPLFKSPDFLIDYKNKKLVNNKVVMYQEAFNLHQ